MVMHLRDIGLFVKSARTDARLHRLRATTDDREAFDQVYRDGDPWASNDPRYRYQRRKYDRIASLLPPRPFLRALELGAGGGWLTRRLAAHAETALGIDIAPAAVAQATAAHADVPNLRFAQGDIRSLPPELDGSADLLVLADCLYYLPVLDLPALAARMARLLRPGGVCMLANHYFFRADPDSRLTRRIHRGFAHAAEFRLLAEHRRPFYLVSLLQALP